MAKKKRTLHQELTPRSSSGDLLVDFVSWQRDPPSVEEDIPSRKGDLRGDPGLEVEIGPAELLLSGGESSPLDEEKLRELREIGSGFLAVSYGDGRICVVERRRGRSARQ